MRRHPANPFIGVAYGLGFLLAAAASAFVFLEFQRAEVIREFFFYRWQGFVMSTPFAFTVLGAAGLVLGARALRPWRDYVSGTPLEQRRIDRALDLHRRNPLWFWGSGVAALIAQVVIQLAVGSGDRLLLPVGWLLVFELQLLLLMAWTFCLRLALQALWYRRFLSPSPEETRR